MTRKILTRITLTAAGIAALAAIWLPGSWWQWLLTSIVLIIIGTSLDRAQMERAQAEDNLTAAEEERRG